MARLENTAPRLMTAFRPPYPTGWTVSRAEETSAHRIYGALSRAMVAAVTHYLSHDRLRELIALDEVTVAIIERAHPTPYRIGCMRPDFVYDLGRDLKITEINARFPLNGFMISRAFERIDESRAGVTIEQLVTRRRESRGRLVVIKGEERGGDVFGLCDYFDDVVFVTPGEAQDVVRDDDFVVLELKQPEITGVLAPRVVDRLIATGRYLNDFRTIFIGHDKRFLAVITAGLLDEYLDDADVATLKRHVIPTYVLEHAPSEVIEDARRNPAAWVLKPCRSGKGKGVLLGRLAEPAAWQERLSGHDLVLQRFIEQPAFSLAVPRGEAGELVSVPMQVAGLIPGMDGVCFGPGIYRASEEMVVNVFSGGYILAPHHATNEGEP